MVKQVSFTSFIGYVTHEAVVWSDVHDRWFFLPRRCSKESYNDVLDEARGCNVMITADDTFTDIKVCYCLHIF
jgi:soluble calcium-activated nucleotidase 1